MQKTAILLFVFQLILFSGFGQTEQRTARVFVQESNISISDLLNEISKQTGADFSFNSKNFNTKKQIAFSVKATTLDETLKILSEKIKADFEIIEGQVILFARKYHSLSGFITDKKTGETLIGATVAVKGTSQGVFTNAFGFYSLELKSGNHQLEYSYLGYQPEEIEINLDKNIKKDITVKSATVDLPKVVVGLPMQNFLDRKEPNQPALSPNFFNSMPEFAGETGLVKGLQSLPGVKMHGDGSAFFFVRGGERDQNLIIIDDAPIYNPSHMFGFYSLVMPDFAKSIKVYKSDIPANLGDRLSSVIDIRTRDGNENKFQIGGSLNPLINRLSIETPVLWKRGAFFMSFRRSSFERFLDRASSNTGLSFGDLILKFNYRINAKNRIFYTGLWSADNFVNSSGSGVRWSNTAGTIRWNHVFGPKLFSNTTFNVGAYIYKLILQPSFWQSSLGTSSLKTEFTHYIRPNLTSKFGLEWQLVGIEPGQITTDSSLIEFFPKITNNNSGKTAIFYQTDWQITDKLKINAGLRYLKWTNRGPTTYYNFDDTFAVSDTINIENNKPFQHYRHLDPRFNIQFKIDETTRISGGFGRYHQYLQMISNSSAPFSSFEIWLPPSPSIQPQSAYQIDLNYLKYFEKNGLEFSASAYYKSFKNQIEYAPHATTLINPLIEGELRFGKASGYGLEFFVKKEIGRLTGRAGYDYSRVGRNFSTVNNGNTFNAFQDRPHDFSIMANYRLKRRILLSGYWTSSTGSSFSAPTGFYNYQGKTVPVFGEKHNDRLPNYHRLDLAIKFIFNKKETARYQHSLTFSIYNALAHPNVHTVKFNKIPADGFPQVQVKTNLLNDEALTASQIDLIRFMPSLTYKFKL